MNITINNVLVGELTDDQVSAVGQVSGGLDVGPYLFGQIQTICDHAVQQVGNVQISLAMSALRAIPIADRKVLIDPIQAAAEALKPIIVETPVE